jgi:hypothetical protein
MAKHRFYTRRFLNLPTHHAGAYVLADVPETDLDSDHDAWCELVLTDCTRQVSFEFPLYSKADRGNSVRKARILAEALTEFADALDVEARLAAVRAGEAGAEPDPPEEPAPARRRERRGRRGHTDRLRGSH